MNPIPLRFPVKFIKSLLLLLCMLSPATVRAEFKLPNTVFRMDELERAKFIAQEKGKPIALLYSDEKTGCCLCTAASLKTLDALKMKCVIVYVDQRRNFVGYPPAVLQALCAPEGGQTIPKTIVMDSNLEKVLLYIPYAKGDALDEALKQAKKLLTEVAPPRRTSSRIPMPAATAAPASN